MGDGDGPQRGLREGAKGRLRCRGAVVTHGDGHGLGPRQLGSSCLASARLLNSVRWDVMGWDEEASLRFRGGLVCLFGLFCFVLFSWTSVWWQYNRTAVLLCCTISTMPAACSPRLGLGCSLNLRFDRVLKRQRVCMYDKQSPRQAVGAINAVGLLR